MESIAALSLACNILQVIQAGCEVATAVHQIQKNGSTTGNDELEQRSQELLEVASALRSSLVSAKSHAKQNDAERRLLEISDRCCKNVVKLNHKLSKLKSTGKWHDSLVKGVKSIRSKDEIEKLEHALQADMSLMQTQLLTHIRLQNDAIATTQQANFLVFDTDLRNFIQQVATGNRVTQDLIRDTHENSTKHNQLLHAETQHEVRTEHLLTRQAIYSDTGNKMNAAQHSGLRREKRIRFLKSLKFPEMNSRANEVSQAYPNTYQWIFQHGANCKLSSTRWDSFPEWLCNTQPFYWIQGSAGSGKSTLMKFILENLETEISQDNHAKGHPVILSHFFWLAGSDLQNSLKGLLCSLLHQILVDSDDEHIDEIIASNSAYGRKDIVADWSTQDLYGLWFPELSALVQNRMVYICLDGLDEFKHSGFPKELFQLINQLSSLIGIKICASSRPEQTFINAFAGQPGLRLHDLTRDDIAKVIWDRLVEAEAEDTSNILSIIREDIMRDLIRMADGVFLWVHLAIDEVIRGLRVCESPEGLRKLVNKIPKTLGLLYDDMLKRAGEDFDILREEAAVYFSIALLFPTLLRNKFVDVLAYADGVHCNILLYNHLRHVLDNKGYYADLRSYKDHDTIHKQCQQTCVRVRVACAGMLKVHHSKHNDSGLTQFDSTDLPPQDPRQSSQRLALFCMSVKIQPYHRSVLDFFRDSPEGRKVLQSCPLPDSVILAEILRGMLVVSIFYQEWVKLKLAYSHMDVLARNWGSTDARFYRLAAMTVSQYLVAEEHSGMRFLRVLQEIRGEYEDLPFRNLLQDKKNGNEIISSVARPIYWLYHLLDRTVFDMTGFIICHGVLEFIDGPHGILDHLAHLGSRITQEYLDYLLWIAVSCISHGSSFDGPTDSRQPLHSNSLWIDRIAKILTRLLELGGNPHVGFCLDYGSLYKITAWALFLTNFATHLVNGDLNTPAASDYWSLCRQVYCALAKVRPDSSPLVVLSWHGVDSGLWVRFDKAPHRVKVLIRLDSTEIVDRVFATSKPLAASQIHETRLGILKSGTVLLVETPRVGSDYSGMFQKVGAFDSQEILEYFILQMSWKEAAKKDFEYGYETMIKPIVEDRANKRLAELLQTREPRELPLVGLFDHWNTDPPYPDETYLVENKCRLQLQLLKEADFQKLLTASDIDINWVYSRLCEENGVSILNGLHWLVAENEGEVVSMIDHLVSLGLVETTDEKRVPCMSQPLTDDGTTNVNEAELKID